MQTIGLGKLSPNVMLIGFQEDWLTSFHKSHDFVRVLQTAFDHRLAVAILRIRNGLKVEKTGIANLAFQNDNHNNGRKCHFKNLFKEDSEV